MPGIAFIITTRATAELLTRPARRPPHRALAVLGADRDNSDEEKSLQPTIAEWFVQVIQRAHPFRGGHACASPMQAVSHNSFSLPPPPTERQEGKPPAHSAVCMTMEAQGALQLLRSYQGSKDCGQSSPSVRTDLAYPCSPRCDAHHELALNSGISLLNPLDTQELSAACPFFVRTHSLSHAHTHPSEGHALCNRLFPHDTHPLTHYCTHWSAATGASYMHASFSVQCPTCMHSSHLLLDLPRSVLSREHDSWLREHRGDLLPFPPHDNS